MPQSRLMAFEWVMKELLFLKANADILANLSDYGDISLNQSEFMK